VPFRRPGAIYIATWRSWVSDDHPDRLARLSSMVFSQRSSSLFGLWEAESPTNLVFVIVIGLIEWLIFSGILGCVFWAWGKL